MSNDRIRVRVWESKIETGKLKPWAWCAENLGHSVWHSTFGLSRNGPSSYWFDKSEDALAFKLYFSEAAG